MKTVLVLNRKLLQEFHEFRISGFMKWVFRITGEPTKKAKKLAGEMVSGRFGVLSNTMFSAGE